MKRKVFEVTRWYRLPGKAPTVEVKLFDDREEARKFYRKSRTLKDWIPDGCGDDWDVVGEELDEFLNENGIMGRNTPQHDKRAGKDEERVDQIQQLKAQLNHGTT